MKVKVSSLREDVAGYRASRAEGANWVMYCIVLPRLTTAVTHKRESCL